MLRLNRMTDYAIVVLGALAHRHGDVLATAHLAELTGLAQPTVAKVSKILLAADLVETQRGVRGGYRLTKAPAAISLVDGAQDPCAVSNCCFMSSHWNHVNLAIRNALNDVSLEDLTDPAQLFPLPVSPPITEDDSQLSRQ
jgi:Rrf2 family protein